jgi:endonuclease-3
MKQKTRAKAGATRPASRKTRSRPKTTPTKSAGARKLPAGGEEGASTARTDDPKRMAGMIDILSREFPDARCMLDHSSPFELLIATILAAQCTDAMVNQVTPALFERYPTPEAFVSAPPEDLEKAIYKTGFFRNKAKSIKNCCQSLLERHDGSVPSTMEDLTALGGVGRKTANCVLGVSFGVPAVIVDTHVRRLARRMGYTEENDPDKIEQDLAGITPEELWTRMSHLFAALGRAYCAAKKPRCDACPVADLCPKILD